MTRDNRLDGTAPDTLARRQAESWYGARPVTLARDGVFISGSRSGRFGGVTVYRPNRDIDFGPDRTHQVWSRGAFAELDDARWAELGWTIHRPRNYALGVARREVHDSYSGDPARWLDARYKGETWADALTFVSFQEGELEFATTVLDRLAAIHKAQKDSA